MPEVIYKLGKDISTDEIYPGRFMATVLPNETPEYAVADIPELNELLKKDKNKKDRVIIADWNFGCGSSREQAASTLKGYELIVIAKSFARIFVQNSLNLGLRTVICPGIEAEVGDELEIFNDKVVNKTTGKEFEVEAHHPARQKIIDAGGLIPYTRKRLLEQD